MNRVVIETRRLKLICCDEAMLLAAIESDQAIGKLLGVNAARPWTENNERSFRFSLEKISSHPEEKKWWTYFHLLKKGNLLTGSCGFKGKPDENGTVEIGYEVARDYRNHGIATEIARALIEFAFSHDEVKLVCAHTLPEENASVRVLRKCGMQFSGESSDDDVGKVWRWELSKNSLNLNS